MLSHGFTAEFRGNRWAIVIDGRHSCIAIYYIADIYWTYSWVSLQLFRLILLTNVKLTVAAFCSKWSKQCIAVSNNLCLTATGNSDAIWDHPAEVRIPLLPPAEAGTWFSDPGWMQGWVDLCCVKADRPGIEPATCQLQVQRPIAAPPRNQTLVFNCDVTQPTGRFRMTQTVSIQSNVKMWDVSPVTMVTTFNRRLTPVGKSRLWLTQLHNYCNRSTTTKVWLHI